MRLRTKILIGFAVLLIGAGVFGYFQLQNFKQQFAGRRASLDVMEATPADFGLPFEPFRVTNADGIRIAGWLIEASSPKGSIIVAHGFGLNKSHMLGRGKVLHDLGYNIALIDLRARGESGGEVAEIGPESAEDINSVYRWLVTQAVAEDLPLFVYGFSHGARAAIFSAAELDYAGVIAEAPPYSLSEGMKRSLNLPFAPPLPEGDIKAAIGSFAGTPLLLLLGDGDLEITAAQAEELLSYSQNPLSRYKVFAETGHGVWKAENEAEYSAALAEFLEKIPPPD